METRSRKCEACGSEIPKKSGWSYASYATRRYCNRECAVARTPSLETSYEVVMGGCWEWRGHVDRNGYGRGYDHRAPKGSRSDWAHRLSYRKRFGRIPDGLEIDHKCGNTLCINPDHLQALTREEHVRVTIQRAGGHLTQEAAALLRQRGLTYQEIANTLGYASQQGAWGKVQSAIRNGLVDPDTMPKRLLLDESDRSDIRSLYQLGVPQTEIAAWYRLDDSQVSRICNGRSSGH